MVHSSKILFQISQHSNYLFCGQHMLLWFLFSLNTQLQQFLMYHISNFLFILLHCTATNCMLHLFLACVCFFERHWNHKRVSTYLFDAWYKSKSAPVVLSFANILVTCIVPDLNPFLKVLFDNNEVVTAVCDCFHIFIVIKAITYDIRLHFANLLEDICKIGRWFCLNYCDIASPLLFCISSSIISCAIAFSVIFPVMSWSTPDFLLLYKQKKTVE